MRTQIHDLIGNAQDTRTKLDFTRPWILDNAVRLEIEEALDGA